VTKSECSFETVLNVVLLTAPIRNVLPMLTGPIRDCLTLFEPYCLWLLSWQLSAYGACRADGSVINYAFDMRPLTLHPWPVSARSWSLH
jgi:hypothetical protein